MRAAASGLALYLAAGWAATEILFAVRENFGLPVSLDGLVLALFVGGFVAFALLILLSQLVRGSPLLSAGRILIVAAGGSVVAFGLSAWLGEANTRTDIPSVAVLPCEFDGDDAYAFLGQAAAEEVHAKLAKVAGVQIPAWRSVVQSVRVGEDNRQVAEILRVDHLASCTIVETDDRIELSTSVIDPEKQEVIWSGRQSYASADLVYALGEISRGIADALSVRMTAEESDRLTGAPTRNPEAYEHYLRARQTQGSSHWFVPNLMSVLEISEEKYELAMAHYRQAVELDPEFAEAWAGMATVTRYYGNNIKEETRFGDAMKKFGQEAYDFGKQALAHDPCNAEALQLVHHLAWIAVPEEEPSVADRVWQTDPLWSDQYERDLALFRKVIECEPNNATAWRSLANTYSNFAVYPSAGNEYPAEDMRVALMKAINLDPTNCRVQEYYISMFRSPIWAPRPEDRFTLDETKQEIRSALIVNPECSALYQLLALIAVEQGRIDEAIAWHLRRHELAPDNPNVGVCEISAFLSGLGFVEEAKAWARKAEEAGFYWCWEQDIECFQSRDAYFGEACKAQRMATANELMDSSWGTASPVIRVFKYRQAMYEGQSSDRPDLVRKWLDEGLEWMGTDDPVAILGKNPRRLVSARHEGLALVPIFRDLGLDDAAERMLGLCVRDPADPEQIVFGMDNSIYVDARHRSLAGDKAEAMALLERAVRKHQTFSGWPSPGRMELMFDRALDPLREDPAYAPRLERLLDEYDAWLAPARARVANALETGDWASLRTLLDEDPALLAASPAHGE